MSNSPAVCIVVPLYNETEAVAGLVRNLSELAGEYEVVLVDASDDKESGKSVTGAVEKFRYPERISVIHSDVRGRAVQMNLGAASCEGGIVLFLHCDTRLPVDAIALVGKATSGGSNWGRFDVDIESAGISYRIIETMLRIRSRVRRLATGDQAIFVARDLFKQVGGFPEISLMEDIALSDLLNQHGAPALVTTAVVTSGRRWENAGVFRTIFLMWKLRFLYWIGVDPARLVMMYRDER